MRPVSGFALDEFDQLVDRVMQAASSKRLVEAVLSPRFVREFQTYLAREMDAGLKQAAHMDEGDVLRVRGVLWSGWAMHRIRKYGEIVVEGTRFYFRKRRVDDGRRQSIGRTIKDLKAQDVRTSRDAVELARLQRLYRTMTDTRKAKLSPKERADWEKTPIRNRPWERVWRKRASGRRYSDSSNMMRDTGRMAQGLISMRLKVVLNSGQGVLTFEPAAPVKYFARQNTLRPMWHLQVPKDVDRVRLMIGRHLIDHLAQALGGEVS